MIVSLADLPEAAEVERDAVRTSARQVFENMVAKEGLGSVKKDPCRVILSEKENCVSIFGPEDDETITVKFVVFNVKELPPDMRGDSLSGILSMGHCGLGPLRMSVSLEENMQDVALMYTCSIFELDGKPNALRALIENMLNWMLSLTATMLEAFKHKRIDARKPSGEHSELEPDHTQHLSATASACVCRALSERILAKSSPVVLRVKP